MGSANLAAHEEILMIFNIPLNNIDEALHHDLVGTLGDRQIEFKELSILQRRMHPAD